MTFNVTMLNQLCDEMESFPRSSTCYLSVTVIKIKFIVNCNYIIVLKSFPPLFNIFLYVMIYKISRFTVFELDIFFYFMFLKLVSLFVYKLLLFWFAFLTLTSSLH